MRLAVYLPLLLPACAVPIARRARDHLHPRAATRLLTVVAVVLAACSTLSLALLMVVGTAQLPGNPLPDGWGAPEVRDEVPHVRVVGTAAILALLAVVWASARAVLRRRSARRDMRASLAALPGDSELAVLPDDEPYAYALPGDGRHRDRIVVSTGMLASLGPAERRVLLAHERAHLRDRHDRYLMAAALVSCAHPLLRPLGRVIGFTVERWADESAAADVGDRRITALAVGKAALVARGVPAPGIATFAAGPGPVPRRVAALLGPAPDGGWPPPGSRTGLAAMFAAAGTTVSVMSAVNAAVALFLILKAATPL